MDMNYDTWIYHGERIHQVQGQTSRFTNDERTSNPNGNMVNMIEDAFQILDDNDNDQDTMGYQDTLWSDEVTNAHRVDFNNYEKLFHEAQMELYPGCNEYTVLTYVVELIHNKVDNHMTDRAVDKMLVMMKKMCPQLNHVPKSFYECKKILRCLGLGYENIHACYYDCALFYKEHEKKDRCPVCNEPRYKASACEQRKKVPRKVLRYFPLKPRLQRLFMSRHTSKDMRWHKDKRVNDVNTMRHPADSIAWKEFDKIYPDFARDPRNVRLGLATDGFNPFSDMSKPYSMWPVVLFPYNLPPWKCMKKSFSFLTLLIPGPNAPGNEIDVYLRPLIDELKELWESGVQTYDKMAACTFNLRAAVIWTINDFPAYGNLSGWSTHGKLACPVCNEDGSYTKLRSKYCHIGHRRYLPMNHSWRKNTALFNGRREMRNRPRDFSGEDILDQLDYIVPRTFGKHRDNKDKKRKRNAEELNWTRKSIFFELEYWSKLKIRHNLDVMHIEKNIFDILIGTLLNTEKSKDTLKARMDLKDMNIRESLQLELNENNKLDKPPAQYVFKPSERKDFLQWLQSIKFPDGYASSISRNVHVNEGKVLGLKSHDCHVLMQRVLPVGIRKHLKRQIYEPIVELSNFFQQICAKTVTFADLDKLEEDIVLILCKLEKIFPPAFFVPMVHLTVHLPREAKLAGPVGCRWMYPVERLLGTYKKSVRNKARPEGSIVEAHMAYESSTFCSMYLCDVETEFTRLERNNDGDDTNALISVFAQKARPIGGHLMVELSRKDIEMAYWYILDNCDEIEDFRNEHIQLLERENHTNVEQRHRQLFPEWFRQQVSDPYVLATQAQQVFYIDDLKLGHPWKVVQKIQHRHVWDVLEKDDDDDDNDDENDEDDDEYECESDNSIRPVQDDNDEGAISLCREDIDPESIDVDEEIRRMLGVMGQQMDEAETETDKDEEWEKDEEEEDEEDEELLFGNNEDGETTDTYSDYD
ncbi:hypothetical protein ACFX10_013309 [Malus domestica]|uniref:uncharacterized protein n=1 Tax=Malus domestica TaxID=3750 RepID=UPI0010AAAC0E|nr:uncharacterized protein LOC103404112 [Malus domestica]